MTERANCIILFVQISVGVTVKIVMENEPLYHAKNSNQSLSSGCSCKAESARSSNIS